MAPHTTESNGSSEPTEALYREHGAAVSALCRSLLRDWAEAEDAAQQVFLSAHRALLNGTVPREPLAWLFAVARNECYERFRQRAATPVSAAEAPEATTPDASVHALRAGELASVWDEVGRMPPAQREAFILREIRGLSYGQLAAELSLSTSSVRSLLFRARSRLRHRLGDVAAGLGGAQWIQALLRMVGGGDGASSVPAATKVVAVGLGTLALAGGGSRGLPRVVRHVSTPQRHAIVRHRPEAHVRRAAAPVTAPVLAPREDRSVGHSTRHEDGSGSSRSRRGSDDTLVSASGGIGSTSGSSDNSVDPTTTTQSSSSGGSDGGPSGLDSRSDGGSSSATMPTTSSSLDSSGRDGESSTLTTTTSDGHDGGGGSD
jgi:RNA polymerase sigma-70 factor (ECF subfamily)